jgi:tryptophan synthase alpha chain
VADGADVTGPGAAVTHGAGAGDGAGARDAGGAAGPPGTSAGLGRGFTPGRPSLVAYAMAGFPDRAGSLAALRVLAAAGADVIELGVPYADPLADGPVIAEAAATARCANAGGFGLAETIVLAAEFAADPGPGVVTAPPVALMTYFNPMLKLGLARTAQLAREAGVAGFIVPDMPPDSARPWLAVSAGLDTVFLAAPTSTPQRLSKVGERSRGFVYCVSSTGVTGERAGLPLALGELVARVRAATALPVAVGFGVGTPEQAAEVARIADGVIVGSAIVRRQADPASLADFARALAEAVHTAR